MPDGRPAILSHPAARSALSLVVAGAIAAAFAPVAARAERSTSVRSTFTTPIQHVVVLMQENHSFNDLLGKLCVDEGNRCAGATSGVISSGKRIALSGEPDLPPGVGHAVADQTAAMHRGKMDGWDKVEGCAKSDRYACLIQAHAGAVPTLWSLADAFAISDRTFETSAVASWGSHLELVAATMDGFTGDQPTGGNAGPGGGCDSGKDEPWSGSAGQVPILVPSCVPDANGDGPYRASPVKYVPTIMDRVESAGLTWSLYSPGTDSGGYGWAICPTFYECLGSDQSLNVRPPTDLAVDAASGTLPNLSIVVPYPQDSQHNSRSLIRGDNWLATNVEALMHGPDWQSTAIFITYDDCGCFYDPVRPPVGYGVRVPMVIVSPYAKPGFVDHTDASFASLLAFTEHAFSLQPLSGLDANAYGYANALDFGQRPLAPIDLPRHAIPMSSLLWMADHPPPDDDPT